MQIDLVASIVAFAEQNESLVGVEETKLMLIASTPFLNTEEQKRLKAELMKTSTGRLALTTNSLPRSATPTSAS